MRKNRHAFWALFGALVLFVSACSAESSPPESLAFEDSSGDPVDETEPETDSSESDSDTSESETSEATPSTEAPAVTEAPEPTAPRVNRPTNRTCSTNEFSVAFGPEVVLIAPDGSSTGPFSISVPAGTYDITVQSWLGFEDIAADTMEQWFFTTDTGYTSPVTTDSSPELIFGQVFSDQTLAADVSEITLFHAAPDGDRPNSVHPLCVGFTAVDAPEEVPATTEAPSTTQAPDNGVGGEGVTTPAETPATTQAPASETEAATQTPEDDDIQIAGPVANDPVAQDPVEPPAELALTGPGDLSFSLGLAGASLTLAGAASLIAARRRED